MLQEGLVAGGVVAAAFALGFAILAFSNRRKKALRTRAEQEGKGPAGAGSLAATSPAELEEVLDDTPEHDSEVDQELRNRLMDRRITRGEDVDDGIMERLTQVAVTLDSTRVKIYTDPHAFEQLLKDNVNVLQGAIRDLRACVVGASSKVVRTAAFTASLKTALADLKDEHSAQFDIQVDENAVALLTAAQLDGLLQVAREAAANALRHGRSRIVSLRLRREERSVTFVVQDNGRGFAPDLAGVQGKGMALMRLAAQAAGASFEVASRIGNGTRVVVAFAVRPT